MSKPVLKESETHEKGLGAGMAQTSAVNVQPGTAQGAVEGYPELTAGPAFAALQTKVAEVEANKGSTENKQDEGGKKMAIDDGAPSIPRTSTEVMMEQERNTGVAKICVLIIAGSLCCGWVPILFFMAAARIPSECPNKDDVSSWFKLSSIVPLSVAIALQILALLVAMCKFGKAYKCIFRLQLLAPFVSLGFIIWGFIVYSETDATCDTHDDIKPRTLLLVWLILSIIGTPGICIQNVFQALQKEREYENAVAPQEPELLV